MQTIYVTYRYLSDCQLVSFLLLNVRESIAKSLVLLESIPFGLELLSVMRLESSHLPVKRRKLPCATIWTGLCVEQSGIGAECSGMFFFSMGKVPLMQHSIFWT